MSINNWRRSHRTNPLRLLVLLFFGILIWSTGSWPSYAERVRIIEGSVILIRDNHARSVAEDFDVYPGDVLKAGPESKAIVTHCTDVSRLDSGMETIRIKACLGGPITRLSKYIEALYPKFVSHGDVSGSRDGSKPESYFRIVFPANDSAVMTSVPSFAWRGPAAHYQVAIYDEGWSVVWKIETDVTNRIAYPKDRPQLSSGSSYFWEVKSISGFESATARFRVLNTLLRRKVLEEKAELESELAQKGVNGTVRYLAVAGLFQEYDLQAEAIKMIEKGIRETPSSEELALALQGLLGQPHERD